jgi:hypothetical protein
MVPVSNNRQKTIKHKLTNSISAASSSMVKKVMAVLGSSYSWDMILVDDDD